jgi:hypothetical protein
MTRHAKVARQKLNQGPYESQKKMTAAERGSRPTAGASAVQPPAFNGSASWSVLASIQDNTKAQPVVAPGEIDVLSDSPEELDSRRATQHSERYENQKVDTVEGSTPSEV